MLKSREQLQRELAEFKANREKKKAETKLKRRREYTKTYYLSHKDEVKDYNHQYWEKHKDEKKEEYQNNPLIRARAQVHRYRNMDLRKGLGDVMDFDAEWMVNNIYTCKCPYCGETDWHKLGCNRLDNNKPHIKSNVEPCCYDCNVKLK